MEMKLILTSSESSERCFLAPIVLSFGFGSQTTKYIFGLGNPTTVLNLGFGSRTTALNFRLGSRTTCGLGLVVRLQYSTLGWVVGL